MFVEKVASKAQKIIIFIIVWTEVKWVLKPLWTQMKFSAVKPEDGSYEGPWVCDPSSE